ncbi:MAG: flotillin-like FloA family protein, partial [Defluviitaleaceae bacterium]|nr:flotillin-like FloA family protein [Defluviitaleaceae bacterium]
VVEAEAQVPNAIADALRNGNMGVMDYLGMQNKIADTKMREGLAGININLGGKPELPTE